MNEIEKAQNDFNEQIETIAAVCSDIVRKFGAVLTELVDIVARIWEKVMRQYPNRRVVYLAFHGKKKRVRKKNRNIIARWLRGNV